MSEPANSGPARIAVIGAGYVGLTSAACLAHLGHSVVCVEVDDAKVTRLRRGVVDICEPGLAELVAEGRASHRLTFEAADCTRADEAITRCEFLFLCLPTPEGPDGAAELSAVDSVIERVATLARPGAVVVAKSTVPVGWSEHARGLLGREDVSVVSNPEFLREGHAVLDYFAPSRIIIGSSAHETGRRVAGLYDGLDAPVVHVDCASAELAKYACNTFLAVKASYVNELADLCDRVGADIEHVTAVMRLDPRIGEAFLSPGPGWGGSCLPKDTRALSSIAHGARLETPVVDAAIESDVVHRARLLRSIERAATGAGRAEGAPEGRSGLGGVRIGLLGLTFKAGTDDLRRSPAVAIAAALIERGATVCAYDPQVRAPGEDAVVAALPHGIEIVDDPLLALKAASVAVIATEWPQFRDVDWKQIAEAEDLRVIDARNLLDAARMRDLGFRYRGIGRR